MTKEERNQARLRRRVQRYIAAKNRMKAAAEEMEAHLIFIVQHGQVGQIWTLDDESRVTLKNNFAEGISFWHATKARAFDICPYKVKKGKVECPSNGTGQS